MDKLKREIKLYKISSTAAMIAVIFSTINLAYILFYGDKPAGASIAFSGCAVAFWSFTHTNYVSKKKQWDKQEK